MHKILVIRNDKLGDFMLAWPAFALLKAQYSDCSITALVPAYTQPMAVLCPWIDDVIIDDNKTASLSGARVLAKKIKTRQFDASISFYSEARTALALWLAKIPERYGPATKIAQIFLNKKLRQRRSSSSKPEYQYNNDLARFYILSKGDVPVTQPSGPYLTFPAYELDEVNRSFRAEHKISDTAKIIFIHPGSGGSAVNLSLQQYAKLADLIARNNSVHIVISCGPDELDIAQSLAGMIKHASVSCYHSTAGLVDFAKHIGICDLFISGSTGPLHIAGALDVATAAFYPTKRSATALRWQTTNSSHNQIIASAKPVSDENDALEIDVDQISNEINNKLNGSGFTRLDISDN
jgi:ADP-heptose:LPS heptosyltransferase